MSKHHIEMAKAGGSQLRHFAAYRNGYYPDMVIRHFIAKTTHFLLIEKYRKTVDLLVIHNVTIANACETAELLFEA